MLNEIIGLFALLDRGGSLMWVLLCWLCVIWTLILERAISSEGRDASLVGDYRKAWLRLPSRLRRRFNPILLDHVQQAFLPHSRVLNALVATAPLLGLLGTVVGMVYIFEMLAFAGHAQLQFMSAGIAKATFPTLLGMIVAISGVLGTTWLKSLTRRRSERAWKLMCADVTGNQS